MIINSVFLNKIEDTTTSKTVKFNLIFALIITKNEENNTFERNYFLPVHNPSLTFILISKDLDKITGSTWISASQSQSQISVLRSLAQQKIIPNFSWNQKKGFDQLPRKVETVRTR